jgi:hypothetical protein
MTPKVAKTGGLQIRRCQGLAVDHYGGPLSPQAFATLGVIPRQILRSCVISLLAKVYRYFASFFMQHWADL